MQQSFVAHAAGVTAPTRRRFRIMGLLFVTVVINYLDRSNVTYQYQDGNQYHFMDTSTYDDVVLTEEQLGDAKNYLIDNLELDLITFEGQPISVEPPEKVVLRVTYTEPGFKGDTATGGTKPATTETGLVVQVPLFISNGDLIRVNTTTGAYVERA